MTQAEKNALLAMFKAGGIPSEQDFAALIDAIDAAQLSSSSATIETIVLGYYDRTGMVDDAESYGATSSVFAPYNAIPVDVFIDWWEYKTGTSAARIRETKAVCIRNEGWEDYEQGDDSSTAYIETPDETIELTHGSTMMFVYSDDYWYAVKTA